jgi:hypothetical protein
VGDDENNDDENNIFLEDELRSFLRHRGPKSRKNIS